MTATRDDAQASGLDMHSKTVTVPFDFIGPLIPGRRFPGKQRQSGFDTLRHRIEADPYRVPQHNGS